MKYFLSEHAMGYEFIFWSCVITCLIISPSAQPLRTVSICNQNINTQEWRLLLHLTY